MGWVFPCGERVLRRAFTSTVTSSAGEAAIPKRMEARRVNTRGDVAAPRAGERVV